MDTNTDKTRDMDWVPSRRLVDIIRACVCRHKSVWFVIVWRLVGSTQPVQTQNQWSLTLRYPHKKSLKNNLLLDKI
jgi:hypothetical protein